MLVLSICAADINTTCLHGCDGLRTFNNFRSRRPASDGLLRRLAQSVPQA
jgi:hypothetical protein